MNFLPVGINIENEQILIVGGGNVALHKIEGLERFTHNIKVVAPQIHEGIKSRQWVEIEERGFESTDLEGHLLVYAATGDRELNNRIRSEGRKLRCLVNVVDKSRDCDFLSPAILKVENMTVAVSSNGKDVHAAVRWRNQIQSLVSDGIIK
ncbi:precorrin-2 dehydrogenase/sirohydrochlorin ferrochelatase family protein [Alkaliflexus imshenetskii]|uniref:precorrin-2 dehydrogenase/sirohydrochlorin ferrochelatase family protein n=1 Tax=Alkaliflexus imshenetskii TaxID=286730 RepID=UPI0004788B1D|nr:bifunctional precorrin-2 dehydrogenase/sirohydrochlorin ferrochelatase [Alkaliflexus imshenetskii]